MSSIFGDFFGSFLGIGMFDEPPDSVPLALLGLDEIPADEAALRLAFVRKARELHPDLKPLSEGSWSEIHGDEWEEIQWARVVLAKKLPKPHVTGNTPTQGDSIIRNECSGCRRSFGLFRADGVGWKRGDLCYGCAHEEDLAAQREARLRARAGRSCIVCSRTFTPARADGCYCSSRCRQRAYRARRAAS